MKRKNTRVGMKILSILLVMVMVLSVCGNSVLAESLGERSLEEVTEIRDVDELEELADMDTEMDDSNMSDDVKDVDDNSLVTLTAEGSLVESGQCGENVTYTLDGEGTLTISGSGDMENYAYTSGGASSPFVYNNKIKKIVINSGVTSIGDYAFSNCSGLTSITIPEGVTSIGDYAFRSCSGLTSITIPEGVTSIGDCAFRGCSGLTSITIPEGVTSIGDYAFRGCSGLTSITIPEGVTSIGDYAFRGCSGLTSITIPEGVTSIGDCAFRDCSGLTSITIPEGVTSIGGYAFDGCSGLTSITIPEGVTSIGDCAFRSCSGLTSITIPEGVTSIGDGAFWDCSGLTSITIPEGVTSIGDGAFEDCSGLTSITIPEGVTSIGGYAFSNCSGLTSITIPEGVTSIGDCAFRDCSGLTSITIPEGVTSIGGYAFDGCSGLTSITIPEGVTSIGGYAFRGCSKLTLYCIENSCAHTYAMENNIPFKCYFSTPPTVSASLDICTFVVIDSEYNMPVPGASISFNGTNHTTDENGIVKVNVTDSQAGKEFIAITEAPGYSPGMQGITLENGTIIYISLYSETGDFMVTYAKGTVGEEAKNLLNQKMYFGTNENNVTGSTDTFSITLQGRGEVTKYELLADGKVVAENTTGSFSYPVITKNGNKVLETPLFQSNAPFQAGQSISVRLTNSAGERATAYLGIKICKNGYKVDEIDTSGKIEIGKELKLTLPDTVPFVGGREVSFGLDDSVPCNIEMGADGKVKISINKPTSQNIELFKEEYDRLSSMAQNRRDAAKAFGGTPQSFGGGYFSVKGSIMGYGEGYLGEINNGKLTVNVGIILSVKASSGYTQYFFAGTIPFYVSIEGGVSVSSELKMGTSYDNGSFSVNGGFGDMSGKISLKADAGVGVKEMVSVEIEGNAALNLLWKPSNNYQKLYMTDSLAIHSALFGWKADLWDSGTQEWLLFENQPKELSNETLERASSLPEDLYDLSLYRLQDRGYLVEEIEEKAVAEVSNAGNGSVVRQSVYPQAEPKLIKAGGKSYLFWLEDNGNRTIENRAALVYAASSDGQDWGEPVQVVPESQNQTADYQYDLDTDGEKIYITYTEGASVLASGVDLQAVTEKMSVAYAVLDAKSGKVENVTALTQKPGCYMFPQVIVYNGIPYSAWVTNDLAGKDGMFGDGNGYTVTLKNMKTNSICYEKAQKSGNAVVSMDIGYVGSASGSLPLLACQIDTDGKLTTADDREIVSISGASQGSDVNLTSNSVIDANPMFAVLDNKGCLFWYQDGKLLYSDNLKDIHQLLDGNMSNFNCSFTLISGNSGEGKVIWDASSLEKEGICIYAMDYQGGQDWSAPYILAETGSAYTTHPNGYSEGTDTILTYLKSEKQADGSSVKGICVTKEMPYTEISLDYAIYDEDAVSISKNLPLTLTISNQGSQNVDSMSVTCDGAVIANIANADLKVGETKEYTVSGFTVPGDIADSVKSYTIGITAQGDRDAENNSQVIGLGYTDLYLKTSMALQDGQDCIYVSVLNKSDIPSSGILRLYADKEDGTVLWEKELDAISKEQGIGLSVPLEKYSKDYCTFYLAVEAEKEESILTNNKELIYTGFGTGMEGGTLLPDALTFKVTFDSAGGSSVEAQEVEKYMKAVEPMPPVREGYHFLGWYQGDTLYDFNKEVTSDITLTAKWEEYSKAAMPNAGIASGSRVEKNTKVSLTCATEGADIYYTTNGSQPDISSTRYSQAITIDRNMTIKAVAVKQGYKNSDVAEFTYTVYETDNSPEGSGGSEAGDSSENMNGSEDTGNASGDKDIKVKKLSISAISKKIAAGKKIALNLAVSPKNATNAKVKWKSSNKKYATVTSKGIVKTKKAGKGKTVTITATATDGSGKKATIKLKLMKNAVTKVQIKKAPKTLKAGKSTTLKTTVKANGKKANKSLKWTTSNKKYATVNSKGKVTAKKAGKGKTVTITAMSTDGTNKKAKIKLKIK